MKKELEQSDSGDKILIFCWFTTPLTKLFLNRDTHTYTHSLGVKYEFTYLNRRGYGEIPFL